MKNLPFLILFCLMFQSCEIAQQIVDNSVTQIQNASYYGNWRCDRTGTIKSTYQGQTQTASITTLYSQMNIDYLHFEVHGSGTFKSYNRYTNRSHETQTSNYTKNYQNDPYQILVEMNNDQSKFKFSEITNTTMKAVIDMENNGQSILYLNLKKVTQ